MSNPTQTGIDLKDPQYYFNRELSWLEFNSRVLQEALDSRTPLIERLKFTAIASANLDEFFMVRVAALKQQLAANVSKLSADGRTPAEQLEAITQKLRPLVAKQHQHFEEVLRVEMKNNGIYLLDYLDLDSEQKNYVENYFEEKIFPVLTPLAIDPSHPFPHISNLSLNLAVVIKDPETEEELFARIKVPKVLPRFVSFPNELYKKTRHKQQQVIWTGVPLEQVIAHNLESLFPGMNIQEYHTFRVTRNTDLSVAEDEADDLLQAIEQELRKRRLGGSTVRIELHSNTPETIQGMLAEELRLKDQDIYEVNGLLGLGDLMFFLDLPVPELKDPSWTPKIPSRLRRIDELNPEDLHWEPTKGEEFFSVIRHSDLLVHHPYHSFAATVQRFITYAAYDPQVLAIKMTLYRTTSAILTALIKAAENGKQVAVLVELKARFDEENNINWARKLEQAGVHVVYGLVGLKTHTKVILVVRKEEEKIRRYVHIGTGNYNPKTARIYTDLGIFSSREELGADLTDLFNYLTGYSRQRSYRKLLIAPVNMRDRFISLIRREIEHCQNGKSGRIVAKMNALLDPQIIATLYEASQAGVEIDLIIRGMCSLRPGIAGVSDRICVISIIGRYLEHSRIYYFSNNGQDEVYIGSADWMSRNLDRRVEAITPVEDPHIVKDLQEILGVMLADNRQAWDLQPDGSYIQRHPPENSIEEGTQQVLMEMVTHEGRF
jgi:polyphosphate kinase